MPPGICACQHSSAAARLFTEPVSEPPEENDEHTPGCPASFLSTGMGVSPPGGPGTIDLPPAGALSTHAINPHHPSPISAIDSRPTSPEDIPLYLALSLLL